jgi:ceramide glucosyltransferase
MSPLMMWLGLALTFSATAYAVLALVARVRTFPESPPVTLPPVTVFKPLCGFEPRLEENLATLCEQTYPDYQILFGVRDPNDAAIQVVERLKSAYPQRSIELVVDSRVHGTNFKVSNLINMSACARHPWIVIADSDIAVQPDYLEKVTRPLADASVGIVTCLYHARPLHSFWSRMGALFIDTWFAPSVRVASSFGGNCFGFGATIALRADTLAAIGGFDSLRNRLADDYWLGELTRAQGLKTVISEVLVSTDVTEVGFAAMWSRERRWMLTIRSLNQPGYALTFVTFTFPLLVLGLLLAPTAWNLAVALVGIAARLSMHVRSPMHALTRPIGIMHAPLRDVLLLLAWMSAFFLGSTVQWRGQTVQVQDDLAGPMP